MENKKHNWKSFSVFIGGRKMEEIASVSFKPNFSLSQLNDQLKAAEENEDYELCALLKKQIDNQK